MEKIIAEVIVHLPVEGPFDYKIPKGFEDRIHIGSRVYVPFGPRHMVGFVIGFRQRSAFKNLRSLVSVLDNGPVVDDVTLAWAKEFAQYYGCSWGESLATFLPRIFWQKTSRTLTATKRGLLSDEEDFFLCHDLGLSKRWPEIYKHIKSALGLGRSVLVLVPERAGISAVKKEILKEFSVPCVALNQTVTQKKEFELWEQIRAGSFRIVLGTRSGVFTPLKDLGLIIVFDEENGSFKQEQSPFYHVREVVTMRAKYEHCNVLHVSSSPTAELWHMFKKNKQNVTTFLPDDAKTIQMIDMTNYQSKYKSIISYPLQNEIERHLNANGKVVLFLNRRGFNLTTRCNSCGRALKCPRCDVNLMFLYSKNKLVCHLCQHEEEMSKFCPHCKGAYLRSVGSGIEKVESNIARIFPQARVAIYDKETTKIPKDADIIIATQAVFKDIDKLKAGLVAILDIEGELHRFDFRSAHRVYSLIIRMRQAAGEKVLVQTFDIDHYPLKCAKKMDHESFYRQELQLRKELKLPPYQHLISVMLRGIKEEAVFEQAKEFYADLHSKREDDIDIIEPQADHVPKKRDQYRFVIVLKGKNSKKILKLIKEIEKKFKRKKGIIITINVDA